MSSPVTLATLQALLQPKHQEAEEAFGRIRVEHLRVLCRRHGAGNGQEATTHLKPTRLQILGLGDHP